MPGEVVVGLIGAVAGAVGALATAFVLVRRLGWERKRAEVNEAAMLTAVASGLVEDVRLELERLQGRVGVLEGKCAELRRQLDEAGERIRSLEVENRQLREENERLRQELGEEREKRLELGRRMDGMMSEGVARPGAL